MHLENYMRGIQSKIKSALWQFFSTCDASCAAAYLLYQHAAGIDVKSLQYLMGHSNVSVTLDIYTHTDFSTVQEAFSKAASCL